MKKKLIAFVLCLMLVLCSFSAMAAPQEVDLETMTADDLHALINQARAVLVKHDNEFTDSMVLLDEEGIKVTLTKIDVNYDGLQLFVIIENNSNYKIQVSAWNVYVNGWAVGTGGFTDVESGKNAQTNTNIYSMSNAQVQSIDDIQDIEFDLEVMDLSEYKTIVTKKDITISMPLQ